MMTHFKTAAFTLATIALSFVLAACGSNNKASQSQTATKQELSLSATAPLSTIDLAQATGYGQTGNVYESFWRLGKNGKPIAGLASKAAKSSDGLTWTISIRKDAKWSDGSAITAKDFVYSWQRTIDPKTKSPYSYLFSGIKNADAINKGNAKPDTLGIKALDTHTVQITLDKPIAYFKVLMAYPLFAPQSEKTVTKYGNKYATTSSKMLYSGPFVITGWNGTGNTWSFKKNPYYWDKQVVKLQKVNFQVVEDTSTGVNLFNTNKLDLTPLAVNQVPKYEKDSTFRSYAYSYIAYMQYNFNAKDTTVKAAMNNQDIRLAFSQALDRKALTKKALGNGSQIPTGFVPNDLASDPTTGKDFAQQQTVANTINYSTKSAKAHWTKGLKAIGKSKLTLTLLYSNDDATSKTTAEYIGGQLPKELSGLTINLKALPSQMAKQKETDGDFDIALSGWGADFNDPISFLQIPESNTAYNYGKYSNAQYDALIKKASTTDANDSAKRWDDLVQAAKLFNQAQGVTPLFQQVTAYLQKGDVKGLTHNTAGTQWGYKYAYIK